MVTHFYSIKQLAIKSIDMCVCASVFFLKFTVEIKRGLECDDEEPAAVLLRYPGVPSADDFFLPVVLFVVVPMF